MSPVAVRSAHLLSSLLPPLCVQGGGASQHRADLVLDLGDQDLGQHDARDLRVGRRVLRIKQLVWNGIAQVGLQILHKESTNTIIST